ncbi:MAG: gluconate 2-dehydrogenase subunit 3 family protein [Arenicellales bacterium]
MSSKNHIKLSPRRQFLLGSAVVIGATWAYRQFPRDKPAPLSPILNTAVQITDTLIPADQSAGALDIGLDKRMLARLEDDLAWREMIYRLGDAVNKQAWQDHKQLLFALNIDQREALLTTLLNDERSENTQTHDDLLRLRSTMMVWYYRAPAGHQSLQYTLPAHYPAYPKKFT